MSFNKDKDIRLIANYIQENGEHNKELVLLLYTIFETVPKTGVRSRGAIDENDILRELVQVIKFY